jgi:hypothetical protein
MAGVAVVGSGNYELFIDTGFVQDAFVLDNATEGVLDNTDLCFSMAQQTLLGCLMVAQMFR